MTQETSLRRLIRFANFEVDLRAGELRREGVKVKLREQPFQVLASLLEQPGEVITREELQAKIWPGNTFVDFENGLNKAISSLRDALGDSAETPRFVETLPRRGYRFIAAVDNPLAHGDGHASENSNSTPSRRRRWLRVVAGAAASATLLAAVLFGLDVGGVRERLPRRSLVHPIRAIAVLPLENLSGDRSQEYFADGITEVLIADLGLLRPLQVISRTSVMQYKGSKKLLPDIARELNVDALIEGSVLRSGNRVRITAKLIRAAPEKQLWSGIYERDLQDILSLQDEVARDIADEVQIRLSPPDQIRRASRRQAVKPEAYEAYLKGFHEKAWTEEATKRSIEYLETAVEMDPQFAEAWAALSVAYIGFSKQPEQAKAKQATGRALHLDEGQSKAHMTLGILRDWEWDWNGAKRELQRAIEVDPSDADAHQVYGYHLTIVGMLDEGIAEMRRALALDPFAANKHNSLGAALYLAGRYDEALEQFRQTPDPDINSGQRHRRMAAIYDRKGMPKEAEAELQTLLRLDQKEKLAGVVERAYRKSGYAEAWKTYLREDLREAQANVKNGPAAAFRIASDYAMLGQKDQAFRWLERAYQQRDRQLIFVKSGDRFESLRDDPRFHDLLRRMGLPA